MTSNYRRFALIAFWLAAALSCNSVHAQQRPNILLILADNWRWPSAGILGDPLARTPTFDRIAREGALFTHVFNPVPSCSPTRACLLTGKYAHQLGARASLWSDFPRDTPIITQLLRTAGYEMGYCGKGWGPGNFDISGWKENPVGRQFENFAAFHGQLQTSAKSPRRDPKKPYFFWLGNTDTATRGGQLPYLELAKETLDERLLKIPPELPDCPEVRQDLLNYYGGVMKLDQEAAAAIRLLEQAGELDNTIVIYTSDNGWQLPRGLANCYDAGSRVPLAVRWGGKVTAGRKVETFVNVADLGPTILELAGEKPPAEMTMRSLKPILLGEKNAPERDAVFLERERHANVRRGDLSYPVRAVRTREYLYIRNLRPDRWPAGDPDVTFIHDRPFGDVDTTRVKDFLLDHRQDPKYAAHFGWIFGKRPEEELYDLDKDPSQLTNVVDKVEHAPALRDLRARVASWMKETQDPRLDPTFDKWDIYPYYGKATKAR